MLSVARAVWLARLFTSLATTANSFPAAPARAASIVAFKASRVCPAIVWISPTTSPIWPAVSARLRTMRLDSSTCCTAPPVTEAARAT